MAPPRPSLHLRFVWALGCLVVLAGCTPGGQFDPTAALAWDTKKKIQGPREPMFPNGVPGVQNGVPADLVKGYQAPPGQAGESADVAAAPAVIAPPGVNPAAALAAASDDNTAQPKPKLKHKPKRKPKPKLARASARDAVWDRKRAKPARSVWPASNAAAPQASRSNQSVWPAPPSTGANQPALRSSQTNWPAPPSTAPASQGAQSTNWPAPPSSPPAGQAAPSNQTIWPNPPAPSTYSH